MWLGYSFVFRLVGRWTGPYNPYTLYDMVDGRGKTVQVRLRPAAVEALTRVRLASGDARLGTVPTVSDVVRAALSEYLGREIAKLDAKHG